MAKPFEHPVQQTEPPKVISPPVEKPAAGPITAEWSTKLTADDLGYPERAEAEGVEGTTTLECTVIDEQGHVRCAVLSENPPGYSFGSQAARSIERKKRAKAGVPVGQTMRAAIRFKLEDPG